jgi:hypothetical protein
MSTQNLSFQLLDANVKSLNSAKLNMTPVSTVATPLATASAGQGTVGTAVTFAPITANSIVLMSYNTPTHTLALAPTITPGTGFTATGDATATFSYVIIN